MKRRRNVELKAALFEQGFTQRGLAQATGIPEAHISMGINGKYVFGPVQMSKIARVLGKTERELFPESE